MRFSESSIPGAWIIDIEPAGDERGFFARTFCREELKQHGLAADIPQQGISWNPTQGTLRGLHFQASPHGEEKIIRVTRGAIFDVIVDLRRNSGTFAKWFSLELDADSHRQLYVPKGVAHGFQTLTDNTEIVYQMTTPYRPEAAQGLRWDDPNLEISWPRPPTIISERDRGLPALCEINSGY